MLFDNYDEPVVCKHCNADIGEYSSSVEIIIESMDAYRTYTIGDAELPVVGGDGISTDFLKEQDDVDVSEYYHYIEVSYRCEKCNNVNMLHIGDDSLELEPNADNPIYKFINSHDQRRITLFNCSGLVLITTKWHMERSINVPIDCDIHTIGELRDFIVNMLFENCSWQQIEDMSYPDDIEYGDIKEVEFHYEA